MMGIESVSAGQYIVTLEFINDFKGNCGKENYCFKQRITSNCMQPEVDLLGSKNNGHGILTFNGSEWLKKWRYATEAEKVEYDRLGKPYDVTTLLSNTKPKLSRFTPGTYVVSLRDGAKGISIFDKGMVAEVTGYGKIRLNNTIWSCSDEDGIKWFATSEEATKFSNELLGIPNHKSLPITPPPLIIPGCYYKFNWDFIKSTANNIVVCKISTVTNSHITINWRNYLWENTDFKYSNHDVYDLARMSNVVKLSLEEVQQYLPDNHPDKIKTEKESEYFYIKYDESISEVQFNQLCEVLTKKYGKFTPHCGWQMNFEMFKMQKFIRTKNQSWYHEVNWCIDNNEQGIKKQKSIYDFIGKTTYNPHTFEPVSGTKPNTSTESLPQMEVGKWYELISTITGDRWIIKFKEKTSTLITVFKASTPHDNYKDLGGGGGFVITQVKNVKRLTDLSEVYRLFPDEFAGTSGYDNTSDLGGGGDWWGNNDITISVNRDNYSYSVDPIKSIHPPKTLKHQSPYVIKEKTKKSNKFIRITR